MRFVARGSRRFFTLALWASALAACGGPSPRPSVAHQTASASTSALVEATRKLGPGLHFDLGAVDQSVSPCDDFYAFACGPWRAAHPLPADQAKWSWYSEMTAVNVARARAILDDAVEAGEKGSPAEQRVGAYYAACLDQATIDARGLEPIRALLDAIGAIKTSADAQRVLVDLHRHWVEAAFSIVASPDIHDAKEVIAWLDKGSLGMPDASDYTSAEDASRERRAQYSAHLERLFGRLGDAAPLAKKAAERTLAFETSLAEKALSRAERRKRENLDHPMTVAELARRYRSIDWPAYFSALGVGAIDRVNVTQPAWYDALDQQLSKKDLGGLRDYLRMMLVRFESHALPAALEAEVFDFTQRTLRGKKEQSPRTERCVALVDDDVGDDVGRVFVERYFDSAARARVTALSQKVLAAYRADLDTTDWLGPDARARAKTKLDNMLLVLGRSNRPRALDGLTVARDDAFGNAWRAQALTVATSLEQVGKPVDRETFFDALPQQLDGFGSKSKNATGFTAGFLQPPLLDPDMDDAVIFGGLGSVIGHELSHQLDDEGRKYDVDGSLRDWWSETDVARFRERAQCFVDEYSAFSLEDGTPIDGALTLGENLADNGGIRLSYSALNPSESGPKIDGFTPAQRFFLAWAQIRCENVAPAEARRLAKTDEHAPGRFRVNGVVTNLSEFARAFQCKAGAPMAPEKRCRVW
ncbi:MAG: M13 family metallopeptidase [Polyangiaceae bacterium]